MNKKEKEAIKAMRDYEIKLIQTELLTTTRSQNDEYAQFTIDELFSILKPIEKRYERLTNILINIDRLVGIPIGLAFGNVAARGNGVWGLISSICIVFMIMLVVVLATQNVRHKHFQEQANFLVGKCTLQRNGNDVVVSVEDFKTFVVNLKND